MRLYFANHVTLSDVGFQRKSLATPLGDVAVYENGQGKPLLLLHGVGAGASSFLWFRIAPKLAKNFRVIAPDFAGWGESVRPDRPVLFQDYCDQIEVIGKWIAQPAMIAAQSLTAGFALKAIQDGRIKATAISLHSPSGGKDFEEDAFPIAATQNFARIAASPQREQTYASIFRARAFSERWYKANGFVDPTAVPEQLIDATVYNASKPPASYSALPFLDGTLRYDIQPYLANVQLPAVMIWGDQEIQIRENTRKKIEAVNPRIKVLKVKDAGSCFEIEKPDETVKYLQDFFGA